MLSYIPGYRSKNPMKKLIATFYYSAAISGLFVAKYILFSLFFISLPFVLFNIKDMIIDKMYIRLIIIAILYIVFGVYFVSSGTSTKYEVKMKKLQLQKQSIQIENDYIEKESKKLIEQNKESYEYKEKMRELAIEKRREKSINEVLRNRLKVLG